MMAKKRRRKVTEDKRRAADRKHFLVTGEPSLEMGVIDLRDFAPNGTEEKASREDARPPRKVNV